VHQFNEDIVLVWNHWSWTVKMWSGVAVPVLVSRLWSHSHQCRGRI